MLKVFLYSLLFLPIVSGYSQSKELRYYYKKATIFFEKQLTDSSTKYLNIAEELAVTEKLPGFKGCIAFYKGEIAYLKDNFNQSIEYYQQALHLLYNSDSLKQYVASLHGLGTAYLLQGKYTPAKETLQKALFMAKENGFSELYAISLENLGLIHIDIEDYDHAVEYLSKALEQYQLYSDSSNIARIYQNIGIVFSRKGKLEQALANYYKSLDYYIGLNDNINVAYSYNNIALIHQRTNDYVKSIYFFEKSLNELSKLNQRRGMCICLSNLGGIYLETGKVIKAQGYINQSLNLANELELLDMKVENYKLLSEINYQLHDYKNAYLNHDKYKLYSDSLMNEESLGEIARIEASFENVQRQEEIENLKLKATLQEVKSRRTLVIFSFVITVAIILLVIVSWFYRIKNTNNKQLQQEVQDRVKAENVIKKLAADLEKKVMERTFQLQKAKEKAEVSDKLKTSFLANMSHEIRTPMNGIIGFTELLSIPGISDEKRSMYINLVRQNNQVLLNLIEDIIDVSSIESGEIEVNYSEVDFCNTLKELYKVYNERNVKKSNIAFTLDIDENVKSYKLNSDSARLQQVMSILLNNAFKFTHKGRISFGCKVLDKKIRFFVSDTGIGIASENQIIIFNRFRQVDESNIRKYGGTGIGLFIAKNLVDRLNGSIGLNSTLNYGSDFYFDLPISSVDLKKQTKPLKLMVLENDGIHFESIKQALDDIKCDINRFNIDNELPSRIKKCNCDAVIIHIDDAKIITQDFLKLSKQIDKPIFLVSSYQTLKSHYTQLSEMSNSIFAKPLNKKAFQKSIETIIV